MAQFLNGPPEASRRELIWFTAAGLLAFLVGTAFRLAEVTGQGLFRMFGTFLMVILGYCGTRGIREMYARESADEVRTALEQAPGAVLPKPQIPTEEGLLRPAWLWAGPRGLVAIFLSDRTLGPKKLPGALARAEERSREILGLLDAALGNVLDGALSDAVPWAEVTTVLTRQTGVPEPNNIGEARVHLLDPKGFRHYLRSAGPQPLSDDDAQTLLKRISGAT